MSYITKKLKLTHKVWLDQGVNSLVGLTYKKCSNFVRYFSNTRPDCNVCVHACFILFPFHFNVILMLQSAYDNHLYSKALDITR